MSRHHNTQVKYVRSLLTKPRWYIDTVTHPNWPLVKREITRYEKFSSFASSPAIATPTQHLQNRYYDHHILVAHPPYLITRGITA